MVRVFSGVLLSGVLLVQTHRAGAQSWLLEQRRAELRAEALPRQLWTIASAAHLRIGFESIEPLVFPDRLRHTATTNMSAADAIDAALASDGRYEARTIAGVVVVRPKDAWTDPADPLNRPVRDIQVNNLIPVAVLQGLRDFLYEGRFGVNTPMMDSHQAPVSFLVSSGTVLDVLNRVVVASDQTMWIAHCRRSTAAPSSGGLGLMFQLRNAETLTAELESARTVPPNQ